MATYVAVEARVDSGVKERARRVLGSMGLTLSDGIRLFLTHVATEGVIPFAVKVPNAATRAAMGDLLEGGGTAHENLDAMFKDLDI